MTFWISGSPANKSIPTNKKVFFEKLGPVSDVLPNFAFLSAALLISHPIERALIVHSIICRLKWRLLSKNKETRVVGTQIAIPLHFFCRDFRRKSNFSALRPTFLFRKREECSRKVGEVSVCVLGNKIVFDSCQSYCYFFSWSRFLFYRQKTKELP